MTRIPDLISIVIPVYDRPEVLRACLKSIRAQTYGPIQVIVVNDGSPVTREIDDIVRASSIVDRYAHQENRGAPAARNEGFRHAKGEYVFFCDADVVLKSDTLMILYMALHEHQNASFAYGSFRYGWKTFPAQPFDAAILREHNLAPTMSLVRADHFPGFDETLKRFQDWDVWLTMVEQGRIGVAVPQVLFRVDTQGTMSAWIPKIFYKWFPKHARVQEYEEARAIIKQKHSLD